MNPYQVLGLFVTCTVISGLFIAALASLDVSLFGALAVIYLVMFWVMLGMQRRARETYEHASETRKLRLERFDKTPVSH